MSILFERATPEYLDFHVHFVRNEREIEIDFLVRGSTHSTHSPKPPIMSKLEEAKKENVDTRARNRKPNQEPSTDDSKNQDELEILLSFCHGTSTGEAPNSYRKQ